MLRKPTLFIFHIFLFGFAEIIYYLLRSHDAIACSNIVDWPPVHAHIVHIDSVDITLFLSINSKQFNLLYINI